MSAVPKSSFIGGRQLSCGSATCHAVALSELIWLVISDSNFNVHTEQTHVSFVYVSSDRSIQSIMEASWKPEKKNGVFVHRQWHLFNTLLVRGSCKQNSQVGMEDNDRVLDLFLKPTGSNVFLLVAHIWARSFLPKSPCARIHVLYVWYVCECGKLLYNIISRIR